MTSELDCTLIVDGHMFAMFIVKLLHNRTGYTVRLVICSDITLWDIVAFT